MASYVEQLSVAEMRLNEVTRALLLDREYEAAGRALIALEAVEALHEAIDQAGIEERKTMRDDLDSGGRYVADLLGRHGRRDLDPARGHTRDPMDPKDLPGLAKRQAE